MSPQRKTKKERPTERTLKRLREDGWPAVVVERWIPNPYSPAGGVRKDAWGFGDVLALIGERTVLIQCCTITGNRAHIRKIVEECGAHAKQWLARPGNDIEVWAWRKLARRRNRRAWWAKRTAVRFEDHAWDLVDMGDS